MNMIPTSYEEELMLYALVEKKDKRTEYCPWCKERTSYRIKEREYVLTRDCLTFGYYGLKAFCEKCEGRMIVPWIAHENLMRLRDAYENANANASTLKSDGGER